MNFSKSIAIVPFLFTLHTASAKADSTTVLKSQLREFSNVCDGKADCRVKKVFFSSVDMALHDSHVPKQPMMATHFRAGFETENWKDAQDYGFVQYIRGCTFTSELGKSGGIVRHVAEVYRHYGKPLTFAQPKWTYDATTLDPLYFGPLPQDANRRGGRLSFYQWSPKIGIFEGKQLRDLASILNLPEAQRAKLSPRLFVIDTPSVSYYSAADKRYNNTALEFKMCLYRLKDIPLEVKNEEPIPNAIVCFDWDSQFEMDFVKNKFVHKPGSGLNSYCATQVAENPAAAWEREVQGRQ